jgi:AraC family transcriptional regulator, alkane utilization regulator
MPGSPPLLAETPDDDLLSELLSTVRLTGSVYLDGQFSAPFGVISPAKWEDSPAFARLRHASVFHLVTEGRCTMQTISGATFELSQGDAVLLPFTAEHRFWNGDPSGFAYGPDIVRDGPTPGVSVADHGGGGDVTRFICGYLESAELLPSPLFRTLPEVIIESTSGATGPVAATAQAVQSVLRDTPGPGAPAILGRLMEVLFVEVVRRHASRLPTDAHGILAACRDPVVSRAIARLHAEPSRHWTVESLAAEAGASRTVLGDRFAKMLGAAPIEYLARLRMQLAAERLRTTRQSLGQVAEAVGYESEAAFSRAFRRIVGVSPGAWREAAA